MKQISFILASVATLVTLGQKAFFFCWLCISVLVITAVIVLFSWTAHTQSLDATTIKQKNTQTNRTKTATTTKQKQQHENKTKHTNDNIKGVQFVISEIQR